MMIINKKYLAITSFVLIVLFLIIAIALHNYSSVNKNSGSKRQVMVGAWTQGFYNPATQTLNPQKLTDFETMIGKKVAIAHYYLGWQYLSDPVLIRQFSTIRKFGWEPMLNVNPYYFPQCPSSKLPLYSAIAQGKCDTFLKAAGKNLSKIDQPFFLVFAWEMNNPQNQWSIAYTGSTKRDFILAWRHIHNIFKSEGVKNIVWVFCPNVPNTAIYPYKDIYPGNNYVDWLGLDGYNWGTSQSWSSWVSFSGVFGSSYNILTTIAPGKPLMLAEVNTTNVGGNKAEWYTDMLNKQIPYNFPKISAVVIYNEDRSKQENVNWIVNINQSSLDAFKKAIANPLYK